MTLNLDRSNWQKVKFGDVVRNVNDNVKDPAAAGITRVLGLEHLDPGELHIQRWGDVTPESTFTRRVRPGQTLFGKRRAYQRKTAYAECDAICSGDILVFESADPTRLLPELLPFIAMTDEFYAMALETSAGSLSPRTRWSDIAKYDFELPPLDQQRRIAALLWALENHDRGLRALGTSTQSVARVWTSDVVGHLRQTYEPTPLGEALSRTRPLCYGVVQPGDEVEEGVPLVRVCDIEGETLDVAALKRVAPSVNQQYSRSRLEEGDVLLSVVGTIGRIFLATPEMNGFNIARALARLAPDPNRSLPEYIALLLSSDPYQKMLEKSAFESARKTLNLGALATIPIPLPPLEEQEQIVSEAGRVSRVTECVSEDARAVHTMTKVFVDQLLGRHG